MKVRVFKLEGCGFCSELSKALDKEKIPYTPIDVLDPNYSSQVQELEDYFQCNRYPKVILSVGRSMNVFINPSNGTTLPPLGDNIFKNYNSIQDIIDTINKYKNEI